MIVAVRTASFATGTPEVEKIPLEAMVWMLWPLAVHRILETWALAVDSESINLEAQTICVIEGANPTY